MGALLYIAAVFGAAGLYLCLPHRWSWPMVGGCIAFLGLALGFWGLSAALPPDAIGPGVLFYAFSAFAAVSAVRVITHPRPIYSALYFVVVILCTVGLLVLLDAEFMAMAMTIIYGGAILVTYTFVIMLATMPQTAAQADQAPFYDRNAREPAMAALMGFVLILLLGSAIATGAAHGEHALTPPDTAAAQRRSATEVRDLAGRFNIDLPSTRIGLELALRQRGAIADDEWIQELDLDHATVAVGRGESHRASAGAARRTVPVDQDLLASFIHNTDRVGLNLFESHTLGIELAAIVLLVSMVGAIVIGRRKVPETQPA